ncbi:MAG: type 1 periplasmic binding fold superfamily protein [Flavobacteriales bacterium]|nr:type 1 periplasmic binding fold superfamily protein [Flavobacteriales bacterium]
MKGPISRAIVPMDMLPSASALFTVVLLLVACKKDKTDAPAPISPPNEEELITSLYMHFIPTGGGDTAVLSFVDADGPGGLAPVISGDTLQANTAYGAYILLLNESVSPADTISNEVAVEAAEHQFFFSTSGGVITFTGYGDVDGNGNPLGLVSLWQTALTAGPGSITVTLRHEPDKNGAGVASGDITNAGGETDIEVTLPSVVE